MSILVSGNLYTGKDAQRRQLNARCEADGSIHFDELGLPPRHIDDVLISDPIGNIPRTLRFESGELFETNDHEKLNEWLSVVKRKTNFLHTLESNWRFVFVSIVFLGFILFAFVRWGIPAASESIAVRLPEEVSATIGVGTLEVLDERLLQPSALAPARLASIEDIFNASLPNGARKPTTATSRGINYKLEFRRGGPLGANAFALPNGTIVVTDELISLAKNDEEILSVLLHEMGHVHRRHSLRMLISHSGLAMLSLAIIGDVSAAGTLVLALPSVLVESSYSRDLENEADDYALKRMRALNLKPEHFAKLMRRLEKCGFLAGEKRLLEQCEDALTSRVDEDPKLVQYLSTHPATAERIEKFITE